MSITLLASGGLGNQLFQYAAARALSLRLGASLRIDTRFYERAEPGSSKAFWLADFPICAEVRNYPKRSLSAHSYVRRLLRGILTERANRYFRPKEFGFDPGVDRVTDGQILSGYFQSPKYFSHEYPRFCTELDLLQANPGRVLTRVNDKPLGEFIAVHVRRGDYLVNPGFAMKEPDRYYRTAIDAARKTSALPLLVFSDEIEWCCSRPYFRDAVFFSKKGSAAYQDLFAMAQCHSLIIANSTYSWWAAWFGSSRGAHVYAPSEWIFGKSASAVEIYPDNWTRV